MAFVLDRYSRRIVGWSMKAERDAPLVMDALMMAVWRRGQDLDTVFLGRENFCLFKIPRK
ncbi:transposase InsO family protein [Martelella radicis]|uniref:Transposase InsO family protein n=1 Tax=Martelella radicis TaxID=1397476 RepID=A0A7W6KNJ0_9HYPH|nr:transposase InsO family protein [Martelella radicis]